MNRYDIAVIGTGPAGISAAITAKIRNKNVLLLGSRDLSPKISKAHRIDNYVGLPAVSGSELAERLRGHLDNVGVNITERQVGAVYSMGDYFALQIGEEMLEATSVIVATGVVQAKALEGEEKFLGRGVSYCATCDGRLYKGKTVAVLGYSAESAEEALYLSEIVDNVIYFPMNDELPEERSNIKIIREKPLAIVGDNTVTALKTEAGEHKTYCVFVLRDAIMPDKLIPGVETDGAHIKVDINMKTNINGLFACGDIAGKPYQYIKAAGQGNIAAISAITYLNSIKKEV